MAEQIADGVTLVGADENGVTLHFSFHKPKPSQTMIDSGGKKGAYVVRSVSVPIPGVFIEEKQVKFGANFTISRK